jgi:hypothetical protein
MHNVGTINRGLPEYGRQRAARRHKCPHGKWCRMTWEMIDGVDTNRIECDQCNADWLRRVRGE